MLVVLLQMQGQFADSSHSLKEAYPTLSWGQRFSWIWLQNHQGVLISWRTKAVAKPKVARNFWVSSMCLRHLLGFHNERDLWAKMVFFSWWLVDPSSQDLRFQLRTVFRFLCVCLCLCLYPFPFHDHPCWMLLERLMFLRLAVQHPFGPTTRYSANPKKIRAVTVNRNKNTMPACVIASTETNEFNSQ